MSENLSCPECDSTNIKTETISETTKLPFSRTIICEKMFHICEECGEKGSFSNQIVEENHANYYLSLKESNKLSVEDISQYLSDHGHSMAHIERSLGLAQRTLSRWKTQGISASGMALMRIIRTYPWILNVADANFDEQFANGELLNQAGEVFKKHCPPSVFNFSGSADTLSLNVVWHRAGVPTFSSDFEYPDVTIPSQSTQTITI